MFFTDQEATLHSSHQDITLNASPDDGGHNDETSNDEKKEEGPTPMEEQKQ